LQVVQIDGERTRGEGAERHEQQHTEARVFEGAHAQNSPCIAK
jgi:hypothetical protein